MACSTSIHFLSFPTFGPPSGRGSLLAVRFIITRPPSKKLTAKRLPIPLGGPKVGKDKKWIEVEQAIRDAGVQASVVAPHSSVQGLIYFDLRSQFELLNNAHLYVPEVVAIEKNHGLLYFEIDLSRSAER